ncbi:Mur ligase [Chytriomyces cf. hyalinus JEL632]|nr:Mur ligase [Chytriomyces cf. hyalinus JEL632]
MSINFLHRQITRMAPKRSYNECVDLLNSCQSNAAVLEAVRKAGNSLNKLSLPEIKTFIERIGYDVPSLNSLNVIHVAGTKGKGSTSILCDAILRNQTITYKIPSNGSEATRPLKTGLFTSPHLIQVRERIRINGVPVSEDAFSESFSKVWDAFGSDPKPGYFRFLFLMSLHTFITNKVDVAIMETGVGGEYDCTNIFEKPSVTAITSLGYDHMGLLGNTIDEIAWHKGGIMKPGVACFTAPQPDSAMQILRNRSIERHVAPAATSLSSSAFPLHEIAQTDIEAVHPMELGLKGDHQYINAAVAHATCKEWVNSYNQSRTDSWTTFSNEGVKVGLASARWPGRSQTLKLKDHQNATFHLDGAHTPESLAVCAAWFNSVLEKHEATQNVLMFYCTGGRLADDLLAPLTKTAAAFDQVIFCSIETKIINPSHTNNTVFKDTNMKVQKANQAAWERVSKNTIHEGAQVLLFNNIDDALELAEQSSVPRNVFVTGSMYLVGTVLTHYNVDVE